MEGINGFLSRIKYPLIYSTVPIYLQIDLCAAAMMRSFSQASLIAIDAGVLSLEHTFHYVAIVLRLLRRLYQIVAEDLHFGHFVSVSKIHVQ